MSCGCESMAMAGGGGCSPKKGGGGDKNGETVMYGGANRKVYFGKRGGRFIKIRDTKGIIRKVYLTP